MPGASKRLCGPLEGAAVPRGTESLEAKVGEALPERGEEHGTQYKLQAWQGARLNWMLVCGEGGTCGSEEASLHICVSFFF